MKTDQVTRRSVQVPPSWFVRATSSYKCWCSISVCGNCGLTGKREDVHPVDPCPNCGGSSLEERVGKWISTSKWWNLRERGYWKIHREVRKKRNSPQIRLSM